MSSDLDYFADDFQSNSHQRYEELRARCPIARVEVPVDWFVVTREQDVRSLLMNYKLWTSDQGPGLAHVSGGVLVSVDPPQHTSDRRLISAAFAPKDLLAMEPDITKLVDELISGFVGAGRGDLMELLAVPVPLIVIAWLLGLDPDVILELRPRADAVIARDPITAAQIASRQAERDYFSTMIGARRLALAAGDDLPPDTLTALIVTELDGRTLTDEEVMGFMSFLFIAGSQTTTQLIGNMIHRLLQHPDQLELVRGDRSMITNAVEESLRFDAPVHGLFRTNTEDTVLHGVDIPKNSKVMCSFGAANLDPEVWEDPMRFDIRRDVTQLKKGHYAFGKGIHYCMGAPLARVEAAVALGLVLDRLPNLRLTGTPKEIAAPVLHGVDSLPVAWDPPEGQPGGEPA